MPFPRPETTPPVTKMCFILLSFFPVIKGEGRLFEGSFPYGRTPLRSSFLCRRWHAVSVSRLGVFQENILYTNNIERSIAGYVSFVNPFFASGG